MTYLGTSFGTNRKQRRRQQWLWNGGLGRPSRVSAALAAQPVRYDTGADPNYRVRERFDRTTELVYRAPRVKRAPVNSKCITITATISTSPEVTSTAREPRIMMGPAIPHPSKR